MGNEDDLAERDERLKDRLLSSEFAVLNMLATIAGLFISVASLLAALSPKTPRWYFILIILLCSIILLCVLLDFRFYRRAYGGMAFTPKQALREPSAGETYTRQLAEQKRQVRSKRRWKRKREQLCYVCLALTIALFVIVASRY